MRQICGVPPTSNTVRQADGGKAEQKNWIRRLRNRSMKKIAIREYFIDFALVYVPRSRDTDGHAWKLRASRGRLLPSLTVLHRSRLAPASMAHWSSRIVSTTLVSILDIT